MMSLHVITSLASLLCVILAQDTELPVWVNDLRQEVCDTGVLESRGTGAELGFLEAVDSAGSVTYGGGSGVFSVNRDTGQVTLAVDINREVQDSYNISFIATDTSGNSIVTSCEMRVLDVNDNSPEFLQTPYRAFIPEDAANGTVVYDRISARDLDLGENAEIEFSCDGSDSEEASIGCAVFTVETYTGSTGGHMGRVRVRQPLDFETTPSYVLTIRATDLGTPPLASSVSLVIQVTDVQDSPPVFLPDSLTLVVRENEALDTPLSPPVRARDQDTQVPRPLFLEIVSEGSISENSGLFALSDPALVGDNLYEASVLVKGVIDREKIGNSYTFQVKATELDSAGQLTSASAVMNVSVSIRDENDNRPRFSKADYSVTIPEALVAGTELPGLDLQVNDLDIGDWARYELSVTNDPQSSLPVDMASVYSVSPTSAAGQTNAVLVVRDPQYLNYEVEGYRVQYLKVVAKETQTVEERSSEATVQITLTDINDNFPQFSRSTFSVSVQENSEVGKLVATITADDVDSGVFGEVTYALIGTGSEKFNVNSQTGEVTLNQTLDFEENSVIVMEYQATDGGGLTSTIPFRVNVMGYNDQAPVFVRDQYEAIVLEMETELRPELDVDAYDDDSELRETYSIIAGNTPDNAFEIDPLGRVTLKRPVDYSETPDQSGLFSLLIEVSDGILSSTVYAYITIRDVNNHRPVFWQGVYEKRLSEVVPEDTYVVTVNASDMDSLANSRISYRIHRGHQDNFRIDPGSGVITTAVPDLDIQTYGDFYTVIVHAVDSGSPQLTGTAEVLISVFDANNQIPSFQRDAFVVTVLENAPVGTSVAEITATDPDSTAALVYRIQPASITASDKSGNSVVGETEYDYMNAFVVDPVTGEISTALPLDRNQVARVTLVMEVNDTNAEMPDVQVDSAVVQINILPFGDGVYFPPPWTPDSRQFVITVNEEIPLTSPIFQLRATDPETGSVLTDYRKFPGSDPQGYFTVDRQTGHIYPARRLDFESLGANNPLSFQIQAFTDAPDVRSADATVTVRVTDINDHSPEFEEDNYRFSLPETNGLDPEPLGKVGEVKATDKDAANNSDVTYWLTGQGEDVFYIDPHTGEIFVGENQTLDRESRPTYRLLVTATDSGSQERRNTSVPLEIVVEDVNDNIPSFQQDPYNIYTLETVDAQTSLGQVTAFDGDEGRNGRVDYSIVSQQETGLFYIESGTGIIRTSRPLTGLSQDQAYTLLVRARDNGLEPQGAEVVVNVYVNNLQAGDNTPRVTTPTENQVFDVPEGTNISSEILVVEASPRNPDNPNSRVTFSFLENDALNDGRGKFAIDPETGSVILTGELDYENGGNMLQLIIVIRSNDEPPGEVQRRIFINVTNINDNRPQFVGCLGVNNPGSVSVREGEPKGTEVTKVQACDADGDMELYYYLMAGHEVNVSGVMVPHFYINKTSGVIYTEVVLDRETIDSYNLCIKATDTDLVTPTPDGCSRRERRQTDSSADTLWLRVSVQDVDDNGPTFEDLNGRQQTFSQGILATTRFGSSVIIISAGDLDSDPSSIQYSLTDQTYIHSTDGSIQNTEGAFKVDQSTGLVVTNLRSYIPYIGGYFEMVVVATDSEGRTARADLFVYVVREFQRLRFIFDSKPDEVKGYYQVFLQQVRNYFTDLDINSDSLHYSVQDEGRVDFDKTDLCFHVVTNNRVLNADQALQRFEHKSETDPSLQGLYSRYEMEEIDVCEVKTTTRWWSGYWWLWWLLIALALFILLVSLIMLCCICYFWPRYKRNTYKEKPYVILDPPAPLSNPGYEWQEDIVKMD